jgi:hypothetical protein
MRLVHRYYDTTTFMSQQAIKGIPRISGPEQIHSLRQYNAKKKHVDPGRPCPNIQITTTGVI